MFKYIDWLKSDLFLIPNYNSPLNHLQDESCLIGKLPMLLGKNFDKMFLSDGLVKESSKRIWLDGEEGRLFCYGKISVELHNILGLFLLDLDT